MPRFRLRLEYHGGGFVGWQRQHNGLSVQEVLETAVERLVGRPVRVQAAGRTDAGVHALGQVVHLDLDRDWPVATLRDALNFHLKPHLAAVLDAARVADDFNARRDARRRTSSASATGGPAVVDHGRVGMCCAARRRRDGGRPAAGGPP
jgi:tRNA pseudouridine38-40 synthase